MSKSVFEKVKADQEAKAKRIDDLEKKVAKLEAEKAEAEKAMDEARKNEDVKTYTKHKAAMNAAIDGLEVYGSILDDLKRSSLYGDDQKKIIDEMRAELAKNEADAVEAIKPDLEKILKTTEPAATDHFAKAKIVEAMNKEVNINSGAPIAWKLGNINKSINALLEQIKTSQNLNS